ncbi:uncharacterized protein LOC130818327 [Amaranthus tricolor]|uniref:uncharacterized protein LOC130818327 n=1 Tax=Amaranthus tricolor TaxID=29722 RepID=UPI00258ECF04|nr:uncharacterized protein LOC130818327 [Amaranthus tricolor]
MAPTLAPPLEAIKGGGGSIKVGTIGTIGSLMTREIESSSHTSSPRTAAPAVRGRGPLKPRKSVSEASSSSTATRPRQNPSTTTPKRPKQKTPFEDVGNNSKTRSHKRSYHIPMLGSENIHLEKTPIRDKPTKKGSYIVDIVDINCGNPGVSLSNRLKKLNFSKLSQSFM